MAWMPVAEAAAALGVSERTIWRRIKSNNIESRSESGRTLVVVDDEATRQDAVRHLSHVAAAQLSMRKLDADTINDVLAVLADYRASFDLEIARTRRASRFAFGMAMILLIGLSVGVWRYTAGIADLRLDHAERIRVLGEQHAADLEAEREQVTQLAAASAKAAGLAQARRDEVASLRAIADRQQAQLATAESSREMLQCTLDERLTDLHLVVETQTGATELLDAENQRLAAALAELQTDRAREQAVREAVARQSERVTQAIRCSAARHAGTAEGLRLYSEWQQRTIDQLRRELDKAYAALQQSPGAAGRLSELQTRQRLWESLVAPSPTKSDNKATLGDAAAVRRWAAQSPWFGLAQRWLAAWWGATPVESASLAQAN